VSKKINAMESIRLFVVQGESLCALFRIKIKDKTSQEKTPEPPNAGALSHARQNRRFSPSTFVKSSAAVCCG
jgi:hypothetical protein